MAVIDVPGGPGGDPVAQDAPRRGRLPRRRQGGSAADAPDAAAGRGAQAVPTPRPDAVARAGLLVWAPVLLAVGIGAWFTLPVEPRAPAYAAVAVAAVAALLLARGLARRAARGRMDPDRADRLRLAALGAALVLGGTLVAGARAHHVAAPVLDFRYYGPIEGRVVAIDRSARDRMRITLDRVVLRDTPPGRTPARVRLSLTDPQTLTDPQALPDPGARIMLTGHLGPPPGPAEPGGFDFRRGAFFDRLGAVGYTRTPLMLAEAAMPGPLDAQTLRLHLAQAMRESIRGPEGAVAAALMTGDRSGISEATNQVMRDSNLYHIVSISGLHMSMLAGFVYGALRMALAAAQATGPLAGALAGRPVHKIAAAVGLAAAAGYLWLSGGGVPTERAFLMVAVMLAAVLADRRAISLRTVAVAALVILLAAPEALVSAGFQMSFAATVALIAVFPTWSRRAGALPWWMRGAAMLVLSSLIAGLATAPIAAAQFNRTTHYGLVANLLAVPVMGVLVMPAGVFALLLAPLGLAGPALWVMGLGTRWMLWVAATVAGWGGAVTPLPAPHWTALPLMATGATVALLVMRRGASRSRRLVAAAALALVGAGVAVWVNSPRPALLVAEDAGAMGVQTAQGRALSKPAGAFVADSWLRADGDLALADEAAARPGWSGPRGARSADLPGPDGTTLRVTHLSGKGAAGRLSTACADADIVVLAAPAPDGAPRGRCRLIDQTDLRRSGARALWVGAGKLVWRTAAGTAGARLWSDRAVRARAGLAPPPQPWRRKAGTPSAAPPPADAAPHKKTPRPTHSAGPAGSHRMPAGGATGDGVAAPRPAAARPMQQP
ncbi:ComEC/Rec2 family competence protein [Paracoccus endophyticus]|uniref:ComEC/Rec2 family competence protein n=1 Tax=Paracoccus endophyticus TaxID=2233774 RepID=UPI001F0C2CB6|nr:ComEC/Rec2 family competence protein [Paracoccus endophyticus]